MKKCGFKIQYLLTILILLSSITPWDNSNKFLDTREEIIARYENGNKKIVVKYMGQGNNEKIIERTTYSEDDRIIMLEKPLEGITIKKEYYDNG